MQRQLCYNLVSAAINVVGKIVRGRVGFMVRISDVVQGRAELWTRSDRSVPEFCVLGQRISAAAGSSCTGLR